MCAYGSIATTYNHDLSRSRIRFAFGTGDRVDVGGKFMIEVADRFFRFAPHRVLKYFIA